MFFGVWLCSIHRQACLQVHSFHLLVTQNNKTCGCRKSQQAHKLTTAQRNAVEQLHPKSVEYEAHFQRMKALLGEGNRLTSQQQHAQYVHDPNVTVDLRSPSYDACTDMYTVGK